MQCFFLFLFIFCLKGQYTVPFQRLLFLYFTLKYISMSSLILQPNGNIYIRIYICVCVCVCVCMCICTHIIFLAKIFVKNMGHSTELVQTAVPQPKTHLNSI